MRIFNSPTLASPRVTRAFVPSRVDSKTAQHLLRSFKIETTVILAGLAVFATLASDLTLLS